MHRTEPGRDCRDRRGSVVERAGQRRKLGCACPRLDLGEVTEEQRSPPASKAKTCVVEDDVAWQRVDPTGHGLALAEVPERPPVPRYEVTDLAEVRGGGCVV